MRTVLFLFMVLTVSAGWALAQDSRPIAGVEHYRGSVQEMLEWKAEDFEEEESEGVDESDEGDEEADSDDEYEDDEGFPDLPPFLMKQSGRNKVSKKGIIRVEPDWDTRLVTHEVVALEQLDHGVELWVLGRYQTPQKTETGSTMPAQIIQIRAVVTPTGGATFDPPPLTADAKESKLSWQRGVLARRGNSFKLRFINLQIGPKRKVVRIVGVDESKDRLKKKARVIVSGELDKDADPPVLTASSIIFPARGMPAEDYAHIVGK